MCSINYHYMHTFKFRTLIKMIAISLLSSPMTSAQKGPTLPVFENGQAQIVAGFSDPEKWIRHDLWVETEFDSDMDQQLDRMHVSVTRPIQTETEGLKLPVIYVTSPYFAGVAPDVPGAFWDVHQELGQEGPPHLHPEVTRTGTRPIISNSHIKKWVPRGYILVHSSSPGTGLSQGSPTVGGPNESLAPKAVIDWLCGRAKGFTAPEDGTPVTAFWSTGKVGMTGTSYNGTLPLAAATTGVAGLEAIIPIAPNTSYYHYYRSNGLVRSPGGYLGEDIDVLYDFINSGAPSKRAANNARVRDTEMKNGMDRVTGDYNDFWAGRDYLNQMGGMKAALLMAHGFNDWNVMPEHSYRIYDEARRMGLDHQIYYHQQGHGGPPPMELMNRWFTHYLHGVENGIEQDPKAWIVRESDPMDRPTPYSDYPNPKTQMISFYLSPGAPAAGGLTLKQQTQSTQETLIDDAQYSSSVLAQMSPSENRLLYVTPVLSEDLHISGTPKISLRLASNKSAANLSVYLVSLPWSTSDDTKITDNLITRGWADPQNTSLRDSAPMREGSFYTVNFDLMPDDQVIQKGQQIGLMIFSSDPEFTLIPKAGTELTLSLNECVLTLPIVDGEMAVVQLFK